MARNDADEFRASDLIGSAGSGSNGEKLVNLLTDFYPPELAAAQQKRVNEALDSELDEKALSNVAKTAGVKEVEMARVRGGESRRDKAWVTYAYLDDDGQVWKGAFPYDDLGKRSSDEHVSQRDSLSASAVAQQHVADHPRERGEQSERARPSEDPFAAIEGASADDLVAQMNKHPERAELIKAIERALHGDNARQPVLDWQPESKESATS